MFDRGYACSFQLTEDDGLMGLITFRYLNGVGLACALLLAVIIVCPGYQTLDSRVQYPTQGRYGHWSKATRMKR